MSQIKKYFLFSAFLTVLTQSAFAATLSIPEGARNPEAFDTARKQFKTSVQFDSTDKSPIGPYAKNIFQLVHYKTAVGALGALLTLDPKDGLKHPAIIWVTGGDSNSIGGSSLSNKAPRSNDQTAAAYRNAGIVMMYPTLRGGNDNPGKREAVYGEIDDVLAAADFLAQQSWVDPNRIYLGGHSTGGSLVLMTAEASSRFRAVFSFGPVSDLRRYGQLMPVDFNKMVPMDAILRMPGYWLPSVKSPLFVIVGSTGNIGEQREMCQLFKNRNISFLAVSGATHFDILAPANEMIAQKILLDQGAISNIRLTEAELVAGHAKK